MAWLRRLSNTFPTGLAARLDWDLLNTTFEEIFTQERLGDFVVRSAKVRG